MGKRKLHLSQENICWQTSMSCSIIKDVTPRFTSVCVSGCENTDRDGESGCVWGRWLCLQDTDETRVCKVDSVRGQVWRTLCPLKQKHVFTHMLNLECLPMPSFLIINHTWCWSSSAKNTKTYHTVQSEFDNQRWCHIRLLIQHWTL